MIDEVRRENDLIKNARPSRNRRGWRVDIRRSFDESDDVLDKEPSLSNEEVIETGPEAPETVFIYGISQLQTWNYKQVGCVRRINLNVDPWDTRADASCAQPYWYETKYGWWWRSFLNPQGSDCADGIRRDEEDETGEKKGGIEKDERRMELERRAEDSRCHEQLMQMMMMMMCKGLMSDFEMPCLKCCLKLIKIKIDCSN